MSVSLISQRVFPGMGILAGVEISIGELQFSGGGFGQELLVVLDREINAGDVEIFRLVRRNFEIQRLEGTNLRHKPEKERQQARSEAGTPVPLAPLLLVVGAR